LKGCERKCSLQIVLFRFAARFRFVTWASYLSLWKVFRPIIRPIESSTQWVLWLYSLKIKRPGRVNDDIHHIEVKNDSAFPCAFMSRTGRILLCIVFTCLVVFMQSLAI